MCRKDNKKYEFGVIGFAFRVWGCHAELVEASFCIYHKAYKKPQEFPKFTNWKLICVIRVPVHSNFRIQNNEVRCLHCTALRSTWNTLSAAYDFVQFVSKTFAHLCDFFAYLCESQPRRAQGLHKSSPIGNLIRGYPLKSVSCAFRSIQN